MSVREAKLCDTDTSWSRETPRPCGNLAVDTCVLCARDYCLQHGMHSQGGIVLKLESWTQTGVPPQDLPWGQTQVGQPPQFYQNRIALCKTCRQAFDAHGSSAPGLQAVLDTAAETLIKLMASALAARALEKT